MFSNSMGIDISVVGAFRTWQTTYTESKRSVFGVKESYFCKVSFHRDPASLQ